jgi:hypothetical protein
MEIQETEFMTAEKIEDTLHFLFSNKVYFPFTALFNNGQPFVNYDHKSQYLIVKLDELESDDDEIIEKKSVSSKFKNLIKTKYHTYKNIYDIIENNEGKISLITCAYIIQDYIAKYDGVVNSFGAKLNLIIIDTDDIYKCTSIKIKNKTMIIQ